MTKEERLTRAKECVDYNPETGIFTAKITRRGSTRKPGDIIGSVTRDGYLEAHIAGKNILLHRLAWAFIHDRWPTKEIDHIDGNKANNCITNLRDIPPAQQQRNMKKDKRNTSGFAGVSWHKQGKQWRAYIAGRHLGLFASKEEAAAVRALFIKNNPTLGYTEQHGS